MTQKQIEQAARKRACCLQIDLSGDIICPQCEEFPTEDERIGCCNRMEYIGFMNGAGYRQPEIDALITRITQLEADAEKYRKDIAEGHKREEIARRVIEEKRKANNKTN